VLLDFLKREEVKLSQITVCDKGMVEMKGVSIQTGEEYLKNLDRFDIVFKSPGIPTILSEIQKVLKKGNVLSSPTNLFFDLCRGTIIGVTGTKGKGTTATMLYSILKTARRKAFLLGNIGKPALLDVRKIKKGDIVIMELSSFQLQHLKKSPHIAIVLDVTVDHLDHHKNVKEYRDAKKSIVVYQKKGDIAILDADSAVVRSFAKHTKAKVLYFGNKEKTWITSSDIQVPGAHNIKNASAAALAAERMGVSREVILKGLKRFKGNEHRLEFVRGKDGVRYYNDSAATNPDATIAALRAFNAPKVFIIGGRNKGFSYAGLAKEIQENTMRGVVLLGETKKVVFDELKKLKDRGLMKKVMVVESLSDAVGNASSIAQAGDVVIYSPSATSFDMFRDYDERGKKFKEIINNI
ncbi:MAG: UDP-N-acetylmuramoyl-L-alanine--D-glutamate ligase, partial [Patescibacteria group bacterium]